MRARCGSLWEAGNSKEGGKHAKLAKNRGERERVIYTQTQEIEEESSEIRKEGIQQV